MEHLSGAISMIAVHLERQVREDPNRPLQLQEFVFGEESQMQKELQPAKNIKWRRAQKYVTLSPEHELSGAQ